MESMLIRNGRIVTATDDYRADILVEDGRVRMIGRDIPMGGDSGVHDASGLLVRQGGVDVHPHLDWDFGAARTVDTFGTGPRAAAFGGTTTLVDFASQTRGQGLRAGLDDWHRRAESACVDVAAHMIVLDVTGEALADMQTLIHREGVSSFKLFTAYPGVLMVDDGALFRAMRIAGAQGGMICVHAENGPVIQVLIEEAVAQGHTAPKYHAVTRPSLMGGEATDLCPFGSSEQPYGLRCSKQQGRGDFSKIPNGAPGVEPRLPLVFDGGVRQHGLSLNRFVELPATAPAKLFGLFPRKGTIAVGSDADLVLFDPEESWTIRGAEGHGRVDYTLFEGRRVTGRVKKVFLRGQVIVDGAQWLGKEGSGEFVRHSQNGKAVLGRAACAAPAIGIE